MKEIVQPAFVLHRRPYRETSLLVTFFTPEYGKLTAVIRGVRSKSKTAQAKQAWLQPFQALQVRWHEKSVASSELVSLRQFEPLHLSFPLTGEANICALYCNELLYRLLFAKVAVEPLYEQYRQTLLELSKTQMETDPKKARNHQAWWLRQFEFALLSELGFAFQARQDAFGVPIASEEIYQFYFEKGAVKENAPTAESVRISGDCLLRFAEQTYCEACLGQWKQLFRMILTHYLGDKPIMARQLFQA